ncbi:MAG: YcxB family protein, partial [Verrucomicrobia bacterium]
TLLGFVSAFLMQHPGLVCRHTLEITEAGLIERTEVNESLHRWPNICRIFSFAGYLYVYVGQDNVHMIPKRDLTPAALAKFESDLRERAKMK